MKLFAELHVRNSTALRAVMNLATQYLLHLYSHLSVTRRFSGPPHSDNSFTQTSYMISAVAGGDLRMMVPLRKRTGLTAAQHIGNRDIPIMTILRCRSGHGRQPKTIAGHEACWCSRLPG